MENNDTHPLDDIFDAGWKEFVMKIRKQNAISNKRLYRILTVIKGTNFVLDLKAFMKLMGKDTYLSLTKNPVGVKMSDRRWKTITEIWIETKHSEDGLKMTMSIPINNRHFIQVFHIQQ